jgi:phage/plasmid-like protein (TIGR03299 family)
MPADFYEGFFANGEAAWHPDGTTIEGYRGREESMALAGHDVEVVEFQVYGELPAFEPIEGIETPLMLQPVPQFKGLLDRQPGRPDRVLGIVNEDRPTIQPSEAWDVVDWIVDQPHVKYETAGRLRENGDLFWVLAWLDEPVQIKGDFSDTLPFLCFSWGYYQGKGMTARSTSYRVVCRNTESASEAEGKRLGVDYTFRHTKNMREHIAKAKEAIEGTRSGHKRWEALMNDLAVIKVTPEKRELFVVEFIPKPPEAMISDRVERNVQTARAAIRSILDGPNVPDDHRFTAYGLHLAATEYLDHSRGAQNAASKFGRSLMRDEGMKKRAAKIIQKVIA